MSLWHTVGTVDVLQPNSGVCALIEGRQIAIFYIPKEQSVYALDNYDPFGKANVLSRGMIGDLNGQHMVASPLYKQHFNLRTGVCFEDENVKTEVYPVRIENGKVEVKLVQ